MNDGRTFRNSWGFKMHEKSACGFLLLKRKQTLLDALVQLSISYTVISMQTQQPFATYNPCSNGSKQQEFLL